jgi:argininosuccinate lyase
MRKKKLENKKFDRPESNGRLKAPPAPELVESANRLEAAYGAILYRGLSLADLAHVTLLEEAGIIPCKAARKLLAVLLALHRLPATNFVFDPALGDAYKNREHYIIKLAPHAGGWLRTGRARREATNIAYQIAVRERLLVLAGALTDLAEKLADLAEKHSDTIMPDYTYLQQAQPTTLAHYLLSFVYPILRDLERLKACFSRANMSSGGIGSVNGSRLPFKRERLAELLGFQGVITNTRDAMWQSDMPVEIMACVVASIINIDRLGEDLQVWVTQEFDLAELADGYCRESVIMPQKKNPYSLAFIRGVAGILIGQMTAMACVGKTVSGQPDNRIFAYGDIPNSLDLAIRSVRLMAGVVKTLSVNVPLMACRASEGYSQATDLAELIMLESKLPYITAHRLAAEIVSVAMQKGIPALRISGKMVDTAAERIIGRPLKLSKAILNKALKPEEIIATRICLGGAAPEQVKDMLSDSRKSIEESRDWKRNTEKYLSEAEANLMKLTHELSLDTELL